jgi:hypothetical protein
MQRTIFSSDPANFPVKTAPHCRMCNFLSVCSGKSGCGKLVHRCDTIESVLCNLWRL